MKPNYFLVAILIAGLLSIAPVSGYSVSKLNISPIHDVLEGDPITATFTFNPERYGFYTSNPNNTVMIKTGLTEAHWSRKTSLDGFMSFQEYEGPVATLNGWDIAYHFPAGLEINENLEFILTGKAPTVSQTSEIPVIQISEFGPDFTEIKENRQEYDILVIHANDLGAGIYLATKDLKSLQDDILKKQSMGIDVSPVQAIHDNAVNSLSIAQSLPPSQYPVALERLKEVNAATAEAKTLLDRTWAQFEINKAIKPIVRLNEIYYWFVSNQSTATYPGFDRISEKRNISMDYLDATNYAFKIENNYTLTRYNAAITFKYANDTLNEAIVLQARAMDPLILLKENWILIVIAGIIAGIVWMMKPRKKKKDGKKDETKVP